MAELHHGATLTPSKLELLGQWVGGQRWYAAKGQTPRLTRVFAWRLDDPAGAVGVETLIVRDDAGPGPVLYQVPLTYRSEELTEARAALVGTLRHSVLGERWVYDGTHDPVYAACLLALVQGRMQAASSTVGDAVEHAVRGVPHPTWTRTLDFVSSRVLAGEQSNSSIIIEAQAEDCAASPVIIKIFRMLAPGDNPDVVLQSALREAGCDRVPAVVGAVRGSWPVPAAARPSPGTPAGLTSGGSSEPTSADTSEPTSDGSSEPISADTSELAFGHLALAQEYLPGLRDAWRVASQAVAEGTDFTEPARALGRATAEVHRTLALALGSSPVTEEAGSQIIGEMAGRFESAVEQVPDLARFRDLVAHLLGEAARAPWPPMQRIHGDLHLGQVLHSPDRGWILLDFEGEPLRPLAERSEPDQWIRDVAGMLRSIDYAGGAWEHGHDRSAREWVANTQTAFLEGYAEAAGADPREHAALLAAFELDKAMYETVYEVRNRPGWVGIPVSAIDRLTQPHRPTAHRE